MRRQSHVGMVHDVRAEFEVEFLCQGYVPDTVVLHPLLGIGISVHNSRPEREAFIFHFRTKT